MLLLRGATEMHGGLLETQRNRIWGIRQGRTSATSDSRDAALPTVCRIPRAQVYRGLLPDGRMVAIKRSTKGSMQGGEEFKMEIELLSRVHHRNLVDLVGFCFDKGERMLVYEYITNGTLRDCLSGRRSVGLDWRRRVKIALDSARGLAYLHEHANPPIIHRDVKATNILLDDHLTAKVSDFGLSTFVLDSEEGQFSLDIKGTPGYLDPEYFMSQQFTAKSDVYSLGVVMLELITAMPPIAKGKYIVREAKVAVDEDDTEYYGLKNMIDPSLLNTRRSLDGFRRFTELALQCLEESSLHRPTMNDIVKEIEIMLGKDELNTDSVSASVHPHDEMLISTDVSREHIFSSQSGQYLLS
ncbi:hypothetical protein GW17_00045069 [Ensete ventricosum]|uniref:non-specific serine/threonine protein kinase n=1 Tax=Ensete ventricosum TaxID=4639 RepID=A0A444D340_ENSVE|nr:hypothetical protein GW17_00045069 [Ensete ventricosum]RZR74717.1 hypothetical protein BHM03_00041582 [Ensete ventricosum]